LTKLGQRRNKSNITKLRGEKCFGVGLVGLKIAVLVKFGGWGVGGIGHSGGLLFFH